MKRDETSNHVRLAATNALLNSLEFTRANFEKEVRSYFLFVDKHLYFSIKSLKYSEDPSTQLSESLGYRAFCVLGSMISINFFVLRVTKIQYYILSSN